jgi:hypothetical protein
VGKCGLELPASEQEPLTGCCEHGNEPSGPMKVGEFLDQLTVSFSRMAVLHGVS